MGLLLGVDAGGTRTTAWVADETGEVRGRAEGGPANYQCIGAAAARASLREVVDDALTEAAARAEQLSWAGYGIAGADRPRDFDAIQEQLPAAPARDRRTLVNDSHLALRAGTAAGVGVALVSGTGTNAIGRGPDGTIVHVGGYGFELGDFGSASDLGREALRAAMRGREGRGPPTALYEQLCQALDVDPLEDVIDRWMAGDGQQRDLGRLAPLVFEAARQGDAVARSLLARVGEELALSARLLLAQLFPSESAVTVVLGGSVLQRGRKTDPSILRTVAHELSGAPHQVQLVCLAAEPVVGALLLAHDASGDCPGDDCPFERRLREAVGGAFAVDVGG